MLNLIEVKKASNNWPIKSTHQQEWCRRMDIQKTTGTPHIEEDSSAYYYICSERGARSLDQKTSDLEILLYWGLKDITWSTALDYATAHKDPNKNFGKYCLGANYHCLKNNQSWLEAAKRKRNHWDTEGRSRQEYFMRLSCIEYISRCCSRFCTITLSCPLRKDELNFAVQFVYWWGWWNSLS